MRFSFTLRELFWLVLVVAMGLGWWTESFRTRQWRQRAEIAAGQFEAEKLGRIVFEGQGVLAESLYYDAPLREIFVMTDTAP
jgi:hypothetical protein